MHSRRCRRRPARLVCAGTIVVRRHSSAPIERRVRCTSVYRRYGTNGGAKCGRNNRSPCLASFLPRPVRHWDCGSFRGDNRAGLTAHYVFRQSGSVVMRWLTSTGTTAAGAERGGGRFRGVLVIMMGEIEKGRGSRRWWLGASCWCGLHEGWAEAWYPCPAAHVLNVLRSGENPPRG